MSNLLAQQTETRFSPTKVGNTVPSQYNRGAALPVATHFRGYFNKPKRLTSFREPTTLFPNEITLGEKNAHLATIRVPQDTKSKPIFLQRHKSY